jgi:hypothetical protein
MSITLKSKEKSKKKTRMRIKKICLLQSFKNKLFQVPFTKEHIQRYKGISHLSTYDCFFQTMTALGLRHYSVSKKDSLRVLKADAKGVMVYDAAIYVSNLFGAAVITYDVIDKHKNYHEFNPETKAFQTNSEPIEKPLEDKCEKLESKNDLYKDYESESFVNTYLMYYLSGNHFTLHDGYATFVCGVFHCENDDEPDEDVGHFFIIHKQNNIIYYYDQTSGINTKNINVIAKHRGGKLTACWVYENLTWERKCILKKDKLDEEIPIG